jgi:hypothetical protein
MRIWPMRRLDPIGGSRPRSSGSPRG